MAWPRYVRGTVYVALLSCAAREAGAQRLSARSSGARATVARTESRAPTALPTLRLTGISLVGALGGATTGVLLGYAVDQLRCRARDHGGEDPSWDCFGYASTPTGVGWFGGAAIGATAGASATAQRRGCPTRAARWRAFGGALLGVTPGALTALRPHENLPARRSAVILTAPLLSAAGATLAVVGCHR